MTGPVDSTTESKTVRLIVNSTPSLESAQADIKDMQAKHGYLVVTIRPGIDRTLEQNRLWRRMYTRIAEATQMGSASDAWAHCKLHIGVPMLCEDSDDYLQMWNKFMSRLPVEEQLHMMGNNTLFGPDGFPVTRLFNREQGARYTQNLADYWALYGVPFADILRERA